MVSKQIRSGVTILRASVASIFIVHGLTRVVLGTVGHFGAFLANWGFPGGPTVAWAITIVEIVGGTALGIGVVVRPLALWFGLQLLAGVVMVHAKVGWFVVGAGHGGAEYSFLIIACLLVIALTDSASYGLGRAGHETR